MPAADNFNLFATAARTTQTDSIVLFGSEFRRAILVLDITSGTAVATAGLRPRWLLQDLGVFTTALNTAPPPVRSTGRYLYQLTSGNVMAVREFVQVVNTGLPSRFIVRVQVDDATSITWRADIVFQN
jgi:hypothetical protein